MVGEKLFQTNLLSRLSHKVCRLLSSPVLLRKFTTYCSLGAKWCLRGGVGGQFPRNPNWSQNLSGDFIHMEPFNVLVLFTRNWRAIWNFYFFFSMICPCAERYFVGKLRRLMVFKTRRSSFRPYRRRKIWPRFWRANIVNGQASKCGSVWTYEFPTGAVWM